MKSAARFGRLLARLWPLWLPLVIVWALPLTRPVARLQMFGSPLIRYNVVSMGELWRELLWDSSDSKANPLPDVSAHPTDLDLHLWQWSWMNSWGGETVTRPVDATLSKRFPDQAVALALEIRQSNLDDALGNLGGQPVTPPPGGPGGAPPGGGVAASRPSSAKIARLEKLARAGQQLEPGNAFWWIQEAVAQELREQPKRALLLLERAARCSVYDDKTREIARRSLAAFEGRHALAWEEKLEIATRIVTNEDTGQQARFWGNRARFRRKSNDTSGALRYAGALAAIGALMQQPSNTGANYDNGRLWQMEAWRLSLPAPTRIRPRKAPDASEQFAAFAARNGRADLVAPTRAQAAQARVNAKLLEDSDYYQYQAGGIWLRTDKLDVWLQSAQIGGVVLLCAMIYLASWWMLANIFLWRAQNVPSSRATRVGLSSAVVLTLVGLALWSAWWFGTHDSRPPAAPATWHFEARQVIFGSLSAFAFVGAPFVLALLIAFATMRRHRARFGLPPRVDTEMSLSRGSRRLLRWGLPSVVIGSVATLLGGWALWIAAVWFNWRTVNVLALLPPDRNGVTGRFDLSLSDAPIFGYGIFLCVLCLVLWFVKWRWGTPRDLRPFTHGALRTWKEALGGAVAWMAWLYLLLAIIGQPLRARADARLDDVLKRGEIAVLRDLSAAKL